MFVGIGHHIFTQHGEQATGACFMVAAAGWQVTNLDIYPYWGSVVSWLLGGAMVYTFIGWGVLRFGERQLDRAGRAFIGTSLACTAGTSTLLMLVSRPEWLSYSPGSLWFDPWPNRTVALVATVTACVGYIALWWQFTWATLRRLRLARPAQRRVLRPPHVRRYWVGGRRCCDH